jgi:hypothetical protein
MPNASARSSQPGNCLELFAGAAAVELSRQAVRGAGPHKGAIA